MAVVKASSCSWELSYATCVAYGVALKNKQAENKTKQKSLFGCIFGITFASDLDDRTRRMLERKSLHG